MVTRISRRGALEAAKAGGEAFRDGKEPKDCPHAGSTDLGDEFMAHHWLKGYNRAAAAA